jgi:hypothetical protein
MSSDSSDSSSDDVLAESQFSDFIQSVLFREQLRSLGRGYRSQAQFSSPPPEAIPLDIAPLQAITPERWMEMEMETRRAESGAQASSSGQSPRPNPVPETAVPTDVPSSPTIDPTELPDLSGDWASDPEVIEIDRETAGFDEPEPVEVLEVDELLAQSPQSEGHAPRNEGEDEGSSHHGAENEEQEQALEDEDEADVEGGVEYGHGWETIPPPNPKHGKCKYVDTYFDGSADKLAAFRRDYNIPADVEITRPVDNKIHYAKGQVTVPLMAITEGGLTFPMPKLLRQFLDVYELAPHQLATNVYRIICSVVRLSERHNIPFRLSDLMAVYTCARSKSYGRYYFSRRPEYPHLIGKLSDSERHACELVIVKGNYEKAPGEQSRWSVPWQRGRPSKPRAHPCIFIFYFCHLVNFTDLHLFLCFFFFC